MSIAKRMLDERELKEDKARAIALQAGVLSSCRMHNDTLLKGDGDIEGAYKLGNSLFTKGELRNVFESRPDMTDAIKSVVEDYADDECSSCSKHRDN